MQRVPGLLPVEYYMIDTDVVTAFHVALDGLTQWVAEHTPGITRESEPTEVWASQRADGGLWMTAGFEPPDDVVWWIYPVPPGAWGIE